MRPRLPHDQTLTFLESLSGEGRGDPRLGGNRGEAPGLDAASTQPAALGHRRPPSAAMASSLGGSVGSPGITSHTQTVARGPCNPSVRLGALRSGVALPVTPPDVCDGPESRPHGALLRKRGQGRVHVVPRVLVSVARTPLPLRERACCPLLDTRLPPGHTPPCGLRGARPSSAAGAGPVSPSSSALMARGTCLPGADPPFWLVPVTPGKRTGKGEGCWLLESNGPCSPVPAAWPWEVTTLSEPDLVHGGAGAQLGSERSSQFLVKLPGRQARSNHVCEALAAGSQLSPRPCPSRTSGAETKSSTRLITGASPGTRPPASGAVRRSPR